MKSYRQRPAHKNTFRIAERIQTTIGESIEQKIRRMKHTNEPIKDIAEIIYTERKDGVLPQYDIRTDKMEMAVEMMDKAANSKRLNRGKGMTKNEEKFDAEKGGETKPGGETPVNTNDPK